MLSDAHNVNVVKRSEVLLLLVEVNVAAGHHYQKSLPVCTGVTNSLSVQHFFELLLLKNGFFLVKKCLYFAACFFGLNGANPITGAEALSQNFDHFNTFTEYSLKQILEYCGYEKIEVMPLKLYVFFKNPLNYVLMAVAGAFELFFKAAFIMYGKKNRIFTKKIGASCQR